MVIRYEVGGSASESTDIARIRARCRGNARDESAVGRTRAALGTGGTMSRPSEERQTSQESREQKEKQAPDAPSVPDALEGVEAFETDPTLDLDTKFELLRNRRRRIVISYLVEAGERVEMSELAEHVAAVENDTTVRALSSTERKRAYVGLYQCHLPKLADAGVIEYNSDRGHAEPTPAAAELLRYVDTEAEDTHWAGRYQLAAGAVVGLFVVCLVASTVASVPWSGVTGLAGVVMGGVALAHVHDEGVMGDGSN